MRLGETIDAEHQHRHATIQPFEKYGSKSSRLGPPPARTSHTKIFVSITLLIVVAAVLAYNYGLSEILSDIRQLSLLAVCGIFAALLANALAATFRFKTIAREIGYPISFRYALATVSASNLAGALFFQIAGQLVARGVIAGRGGIPFAEIVVITVYERVPAALVSALFALGGAFFIFGNIYLDRSSGGAELIKLIGGLTAAATVGALVGYGRMAARSIKPLVGRHFVRQLLTIIGLALLVHIPMQAAYILTAHTLFPQTSIANLIAASAIVMFATSIPISFAGWGMREMSAIVGLGAIGVPAHVALTTAVLIGIGSLLVVGMFATISLPHTAASKPPAARTPVSKSVDYHRVLTWLLPIGAATLVLFQIYIPIGSGVLNANLADPIILVGGALYVLNAVKLGRVPNWRAPYVNAVVTLATLFLTVSFIVGLCRYGWTSWAGINRFLGWFVLLCYGATGALAVVENGKEALRIALLTFVGATAAIAGIEIGLVLLHKAGVHISSTLVLPGAIEGFSQNRNSFALQLLFASCATIIFARGATLRISLLTLFSVALWFAGSRSGWIAGASIVGISLYLRKITRREVLSAGLLTVGLAVMVANLSVSSAILAIVPSESSTHERLDSIFGGLMLFAGHPIFGAGLGAFYSQLNPSSSGSPLVIHSTAIWLLAELGIVGFLVFAIPAFGIFVTEWRSAKRDHISALIVLCLAAFAVMSTPGDMLYQRAFWFFIGAMLAFSPEISSHHSIDSVPLRPSA